MRTQVRLATTRLVPRFGIRQLALVTVVFSFLFAIIGAVQLPVIQAVAASAVVAMFAAGHLWLGNHAETEISFASRAAHVVSIFATSFAVATVVCFGLFVTISPPNPVDVSWADQFVAYGLLFGFFSLIAFLCSLVATEHFPSAMIVLFGSTIGVTTFLFLVIEAIRSGLFHG